MNRTIKFRAWDKKNKAMMLVCDSLKNLWFDVVGATGVHDGPSTFISEPEDIELMQFTGLHDKNGKEIYEGDILKEDEYKILELVKWGNDEWNEEGFSTGFNLDSTGSQYEVVGNIFENPDLLGKK